MNALAPELREAFAAAARDYHRANHKLQSQATTAPDGDLLQTLRLDFVHELLDAIPREAVAAQLLIETGDNAHAHVHLQRLVLNVRELARTWNETRGAESEAAQ